MDYFENSQGVSDSLHNTYSSPLLLHLTAAIFAFCAADKWEFVLRRFSYDFLLAGLFLWLSALTVKFFFGKRRSVLMLSVAATGTLFFCLFYFYAREYSNPYPELAPRSATVKARIDEVSRGANNSLYGTAEILDAPKKYRYAEGMKMWYVVSDGKNGGGKFVNLLPSQIAVFDGVFGGLNLESFKARGYFAGTEKNVAFEKYLNSRRIFFKMRTGTEGVKITGEESPMVSFFSAARKYMENSLAENISFFPPDSEAARTYSAMILGDKSLLSSKQKEVFAETGTMHVFAISGLHVGFAAALLLAFTSFCKIDWRISPFVCLPILWIYVCACGSRPSAMRAFGMVAVVWLALSFGRRLKIFDALVLAAAVSLAVSPSQIFDTGWTLSYAVIASIFLYGAPLYSYLDTFRRNKKLRRTDSFALKIGNISFSVIVGGFCVSLGAMFAASPLSSYGFGYIAPLSVLYSPFFVLGAGAAVSLGFIGFALPNFLAQFTNAAACSIVGTMSFCAKESADFFNPAVDVRLTCGSLVLVSVASFLFLSGALQTFKPFYLRFLLAPIPLISIIFIVWINK